MSNPHRGTEPRTTQTKNREKKESRIAAEQSERESAGLSNDKTTIDPTTIRHGIHANRPFGPHYTGIGSEFSRDYINKEHQSVPISMREHQNKDGWTAKDSTEKQLNAIPPNINANQLNKE